MSEKILFVDDERSVLDGYRRTLHRDFQVDVAPGGAEALAAMQQNGPYAVVISDMRMPGMNGAQFLAQARQNAPSTVRMLLTGYTDIGPAMDAVNEGSIFRFLTKPCEKDILVKALTSGIEQYRLILGEAELLEKTLMGSITVLTDVLSTTSPEAFGRSMRIARSVRHCMTSFSLSSPWRFEVAATLSQLGCVTLDTDLLQQAYAGTRLAPEAQARFDAHPIAAMDLLGKIPRLEQVAWMIGQQLNRKPLEPLAAWNEIDSKEICFGARMLKLAVAYEASITGALSHTSALDSLRARSLEFESSLVDSLTDLKPDAAFKQLRKVDTSRLMTGMILDQEIRNRQGMLVVARGQEVTPALLMKLENFSRTGAIVKEVMALVSM